LNDTLNTPETTAFVIAQAAANVTKSRAK